MECWVSKQGKMGARSWSSFLKDFWKIFKNEDFGFKFFEKGQILRPFSGLATSKLNIFSNNLTQAMFIQRNRLIPFSIWVMGGGAMGYGSGNSPMAQRINIVRKLRRFLHYAYWQTIQNSIQNIQEKETFIFI